MNRSIKSGGLFVLALLLCFAATVPAQSGRRSTEPSLPSATSKELARYSIHELYTMAVNYARDKFTEFEQKKIPYSEALHRQVLREQKQVAAKYAAEASSRPNVSGTDLYYLGRLHWLASNSIDAAEAFERFLATPSAENGKMKQTARSVVVVMAAKRDEFEKAEKALSDYYSNEPVRLSEQAKMEKQVAFSYEKAGEYKKALPHALKAFDAATKLLSGNESRALKLSQFLDSGITAFEIEKELGDRASAESILSAMKENGAKLRSNSVYFRAIDEKIKYMIETGRKQSALAYYNNALVSVQKDFSDLTLRSRIEDDLKARRTHYNILGETAPELVSVAHWIPETPEPLSGLKGKVVVLDFWATWCGPCFEAFPDLRKWHEELGRKGLVILGVTRYYRQAEGRDDVPPAEEIDYLRRFKQKERLPYPFVVADGQANQLNYGAMSIPTTVIIDRKGIVRYVETGASDSRIREIREMIDKLLAEDSRTD